MLMNDWMHEVEGGLFQLLLTHCIRIIDVHDYEQLDELDKRYAT